MAVGLITPRLMLQYYGSETNGLITSITQFISYFSLIEAGLSGSCIYSLYKPLAEQDTAGINGIVSAAKKVYTKLGFVFTGLVFLFAVIYSSIVTVGGLSTADVFFLVLVMGVSGALEFFTMSKYRVLLTADQRSYAISLATIVGTLINAAVIVVCSTHQFNIVWLKTIATLSVFARSLILSLYLHRHYRYINFKAPPDLHALDKRWDALYMQVLWSLQSGVPVVFATFFTGMVQVSIYSVYNMVILGINNVLSIFMSGLQAAFGDMLVRDNKAHLQKIYGQFLFAYYTLVALVYSVTAVMLLPFIRNYTADLPDASLYLLPVLAVLALVNGLLFTAKTPQGMITIAAGMYKETRWQTTIQAAILVVGGLILTPLWGLNGMLIAAIASNGYRLVDFVVFVSKHITNLSVWSTVRHLLRVAVHIAIVFLLFYWIPLPNNGYGQWVVSALLVFAVSAVLSLGECLLLYRQDTKELFARVRQVIRK